MVQIASGLLTQNTLLSIKPMLLGGVLVLTDGTNAATITVYDDDHERTSGKVAWKNTDNGSNNYGGGFFVCPVKLDVGCYITISGSGASFIVYEAKL
jgi:hypothetical protein